MKTRIYVNRQVIAANQKHGVNDPPITVRNSRGALHVHRVRILGPAFVVHRPDKPLPEGPRVWIETEAEVETGGSDAD